MVKSDKLPLFSFANYLLLPSNTRMFDVSLVVKVKEHKLCM